MEDQKINGSVVQEAEASSTTQGDEVVTKRSLRVQCWRKIQDAKCGIGFNAIFNRIPNFVGSDKAAALLAETQEFKDAKNIKVNIDRAQDPIKMEIFAAGKTLFLPGARESNALYAKIDCPADADEETKKKIIKVQNFKENREEIDVANKVKLDMVVIGSVCISRDGHRIGRGNGFVDLDIGILIHCGAITPDTLIVTTVHEHQVYDSLPLNLFEKHDIPVDIIVTPTEVIRVAKRLPRPAGIFWELLSERRLKIVPVLQIIKENEEKSGKIITLKSEDTDIEANARPQRPRLQRRRPLRFRTRRRTKSQTDNENNQEEPTRQQQRPENRRRGRVYNGRRRPTRSEGDQEQSANESRDKKSQNASNLRKKRSNRDFCVKVSNIARGIRIKDLKTELRKRECNPIYISWKGAFGRCYLHFAKRSGTEREAEIEKVLKSLNDLSLTVQSGEQEKTYNLEIELLKLDDENNRIESVDTTTV